MKKSFSAVLALVVLVAGGAAYYMFQAHSQSDFGAAAPRTDAVDISVDWLLAEGELALGNHEIEAPIGVNLKLLVDSDRADVIEIEGLDIRMQLAIDAITAIHFNAHKTGRFPIRLSSTGEVLGRIVIQQ